MVLSRPNTGSSCKFAAAVAMAAALMLAACGSDDEGQLTEEQPVEDLYHSAIDSMQQQNYETAAREFDEVERQHPYSVWARQAQLMSAYAHYSDNAYDEAITGLDRFINLYPGNPKVAYAYYLKGLCYYEQISDVVRDQGMAEQALEAFDELVRRFPESKYARDARLKIDLALDQLAGQDMEIGRFYQRRGDFLAAINRFRSVIEQYQTTVHTPEALHRIVESYMSLGVAREAQIVAVWLGYNYPDSRWYEDSYRLLQQANLAPNDQRFPVPGEGEDKDWLDFLF